MYALLKRFFTDDVFQGAYNSVTRATQSEGEDEVNFFTRMSTSSLQCLHVFLKANFFNYYVCWLNPSVRELVAQQMRLMTSADLVNMASVNQAAVAIGNSQISLSTVEEPRKTIGGPKDNKIPGNSSNVMIAARTWVSEDEENSDCLQDSRTDWPGKINLYYDAEVVEDLGAILYAGQASVGSRDNSTAPTSAKVIHYKVLRDCVANDEH